MCIFFRTEGVKYEFFEIEDFGKKYVLVGTLYISYFDYLSIFPKCNVKLTFLEEIIIKAVHSYLDISI